MNGFGGGAENGCGCAGADLRLQEMENNLRTREEMLVQRENDLQKRDQAVARMEKLLKQQKEELSTIVEDHVRRRDEMVGNLNSLLRKARENSARYDEDTKKDRKRLEDTLTSIEELLCRVEATEEALRIREQEAERKQKNVNTWSMGQIISTLFLVSGLMLFIQIRTIFPLEYLNHIVGGFAILWALNTMFLCGVFGTSSTAKNFSRHVEWLIYMCFLVFIIYALYLIALPVDGTSPGASLSSASTSITPID